MTTGERVPAAKVVEPVLRGLKVLRCRLGVAGVAGAGRRGRRGGRRPISRRTPRSRPAGSLAAAARREPGAAGPTRGRRRRARGDAAGTGTRAAARCGASATLPTLRRLTSSRELRPATRRRARRASRLRGPPASTEPPRARLARATRRGSRDARGRPKNARRGPKPRAAAAAASGPPPPAPAWPARRSSATAERPSSAQRTADERPGRRSATRRARRGRRNQRVHDGRRAREHLVRCVRREPAASVLRTWFRTV